jgi:hypothetical protein
MQQGEAEDFAGGPEGVGGDPEELAGDPDGLDFVGDVADITEDVPGDASPGPIGAAGEEPDWHESGGLRPSTGEPRVDAALSRLDDLAGRPVTEHRAVFEDVHRRLRDVLGELDSRQPSGDAAGRPGR